MALFINTTETIGIVLGQGTITTTGSLFITLLIVILLLLAIAIMFQIRLEYTAILILPLVLSYMSFYGDWIATGTVLLIYISILITKNFFIK